ncbi:DMT family transporter [Candidatus Hydrogenosomobacter endosymbioticus]|nr:DMT family transporter [Candidatus Hydrogenosomobacter endosymbioticus]
MKASIWMVLWASFFSIAMLHNKSTSKDASVWMIVWMRAAFGMLFMIPFLVKERVSVFKTKCPAIQLARGVFVACAAMCTYFSFKKLPMPTAGTINTSCPLFVLVMAAIFLREKISLKRWGAVVIGYIGILVICNPKSVALDPYIVVAVMSNIFVASYVVLARILAKNGEKSLTTLFYSSVISFAIYSAICAFNWKAPETSDVYHYIIIGACGSALQFCYINALQFEQASFLAPFEYLRFCMVLFLGWVYFGEKLSQNTFIGASFIVFATVLLIVFDRSVERARA